MPSATTTGELNQSRSLPLSSMICSDATHSTSSNRPIVSIGMRFVADSRSRNTIHVTAAAKKPTGMLM